MEELARFERRLERLEKEGRRWRRVALVLTALVVSLGSAAATATKKEEKQEEEKDAARKLLQAKEVQAQKFKVVDADGKIRAIFGLHGGGDPALYLTRANGNSAALVSLQEDGSVGVSLADGEGLVKLSLTVSGEGASGILLGGNGKALSSLKIDSSDNPLLRMKRDDYEARFGFSDAHGAHVFLNGGSAQVLATAGAGGAFVNSTVSKAATSVGVSAASQPNLSLQDASERVVFAVQAPNANGEKVSSK